MFNYFSSHKKCVENNNNHKITNNYPSFFKTGGCLLL